MSTIKSSDPSGERFAKLMAELYYHMAREMVDRLGEEAGREAILAAVRSFGQARVAAMRQEAQLRGLPLTGLATYQAVRDMPADGWKMEQAAGMEVSRCPMADAWAQYGEKGQELGYLYCQIDQVLYGAFGVTMDRPLCLTKGDACCRFLLSDDTGQ